MGLAYKEGWKPCISCKRLIERVHGCNSMRECSIYPEPPSPSPYSLSAFEPKC